MKIIALGGSVRGYRRASREQVLSLALRTKSLDALVSAASAWVGPSTAPSNTELLSAVALQGAFQNGAEIDFYPLAQLFPRRDLARVLSADAAPDLAELADLEVTRTDTHETRTLFEHVADADGVLLISPVYFGDRSSVLDRFLKLADARGVLKAKAVAAVSVGAKRNGGQETTNVFLLHEALRQGARVVGNGPPCSQYGGTAIGGDRRAVLADRSGLLTALETGSRLTLAAKILNASRSTPPMPSHLVALVLSDDSDRRVARSLEIKRQQLGETGCRLTILELSASPIERCLACDICPVPEGSRKSTSYGCIIPENRDEMKRAREALITADGVIIAGVNGEASTCECAYQRFTERTRFLRRNDFELTNVPLCAYSVEEAVGGSQPLFALKVMTSYLRHNSMICPPVQEVWHRGECLAEGSPALLAFAETVTKVHAARAVGEGKTVVSYQAGGRGGYADTRLDSTEETRW